MDTVLDIESQPSSLRNPETVDLTVNIQPGWFVENKKIKPIRQDRLISSITKLRLERSEKGLSTTNTVVYGQMGIPIAGTTEDASSFIKESNIGDYVITPTFPGHMDYEWTPKVWKKDKQGNFQEMKLRKGLRFQSWDEWNMQ